MSEKLFFALTICVACAACQPPATNEAGAVGAALAEAAQAEREKLAAEWQAQYDEIAAAVPLSPAESDALRSAFETMQMDLSAWLDGESGQRLVTLEGRMTAAARDGNLPAVKAATREAKPLRDTFQNKVASHEENLLNALTPQNRALWEGLRIAKHMLELMEPLNLSPEQQNAIRNGAGQALQQAKNRNEPNPPAAAFLELEKWAEANVLSPDQRAAYAGIKDDNAMRSLAL